MTYRTLQDLRTELRVRLGFGATGGVPGANQTLLNSFLRTAQAELYQQATWAELRSREDLSIGLGQTLVTWPTDCNHNRIEDLYVQVNGTWTPVVEGIDKELWTTVTSQSFPRRYERLDQLEIWPESNASYTLRLWYYKKLERFTQDADRATIDDELILARAIALGKSHYRHPDAQQADASANAMIGGAKGGAWRQKTFKSKTNRERDLPIAKPVRV